MEKREQVLNLVAVSALLIASPLTCLDFLTCAKNNLSNGEAGKDVEFGSRMAGKWTESAAICKQHDLTLGKFSYWVAQSKPKSDSGFIALNPDTLARSEQLEIRYPNGVIVKVDSIDLTVISGLIGLV